MNTTTILPSRQKYAMHPGMLVLWLAIGGMVMMFAGLTSAYIVKKADPKGWLEFRLPFAFLLSTLVLIISSFTLSLAQRNTRIDELKLGKLYTYLTLFLAFLFVTLQFYAFKEMVSNNLYFSGESASVSFVYVFAGLHFLHIVGGIFGLIYLIVKLNRFEVHKKNMIPIRMVSTFWHFAGLLWLYLYSFLTLA